MIIALDSSNNRIFSYNASKSEQYFCCNPTCQKREVLLCKGRIIPAYFRHKSRDPLCDYQPESEEHEYAKIYLAQILHLSEDDIECRKFHGIRPDLFFKQIGIEIQRSPILFSEFEKRNILYTQYDLFVFWFFYMDYEKYTTYTQNINIKKQAERLKIIEIFFAEKATIPYYTFTPSKELILFYIHAKKIRGYKKTYSTTLDHSYPIIQKEDALKAFQNYYLRFKLCKNCGSLFSILKFDHWKTLCKSCYFKIKHKN